MTVICSYYMPGFMRRGIGRRASLFPPDSEELRSGGTRSIVVRESIGATSQWQTLAAPGRRMETYWAERLESDPNAARSAAFSSISISPIGSRFLPR
jgi:hypothetical protein